MIPLPQEQQQSQHQESRTEAYQEQPDNIADNNIDNNRDNNNSNNTTDNNNNDSDGGNINNNNTVATVPSSSSSSSSSSSNNGDDDKDVNDLSSPPPYEQVPKMPLPVIVDVNGDDELPTYQQTVANSHSLNNRSPNTNNSNSRKDKTNRCVCCGVKNRRSKFCILIFALLVTLVIAITSIGVSNNKACYALGLNDDPNNVKYFSFDPNALNSFRIISSYVKSGTINVSQSNSTSEFRALARVQYNSLANDRIRIDENIFGNHYNLIFGSGSSISMFGVNIPPKCIVANIQLTLPSTMNSTTNITTIDSDIFDLTFAENSNKYNQTLRIRGDDANLQFNNLSVKSLSIDTGSGIVNGTVKDIEDGIYVNVDEVDLNLNVGIANNTNSTTINIIDYTGRVNLSFINGFTGKYDIFTETGRVITNGVEISNNQHVANVVNTSNNRFTNGTLTIRNTDGTVNVTF